MTSRADTYRGLLRAAVIQFSRNPHLEAASINRLTTLEAHISGPSSPLHSYSSFSQPIQNSLATEKELQGALSQFKSSLTVQQRSAFGKVTFKDLRLTLQRIQQQHATKYKSMNNLPQVQHFTNVIQQLENASSFPGVSEFVSYVWGSVKYCQ